VCVCARVCARVYAGLGPGYGTAMTSHPHQPSSDEADPEQETTPAGVARDLEQKAEELGASTSTKASQPNQPSSDDADRQ
jgi:hypothetical protein